MSTLGSRLFDAGKEVTVECKSFGKSERREGGVCGQLTIFGRRVSTCPLFLITSLGLFAVPHSPAVICILHDYSIRPFGDRLECIIEQPLQIKHHVQDIWYLVHGHDICIPHSLGHEADPPQKHRKVPVRVS